MALSQATKQQVIGLLRKGGIFDAEVARRTGVSCSTVGRIRQAGITQRHSTKRISDDVRAKVKRMYDAGHEYNSITQHTGVSKSSIYRIGNAAA